MTLQRSSLQMLALARHLRYAQSMAKKARNTSLATVDQIERAIHIIRGQRVMLDSDLATLYGVTTKQLN